VWHNTTVWWSGVVVSALASINKVNQCRAPLVLRWVTVSGFSSQLGTFISVCDQPPRSTQPGHPFVGRHNEYQPKGGVPCSWGVKAGMVRVWVTGKTVWSPCYTQVIHERFRDKELIIKRYINPPSWLLLFYFTLCATVFRWIEMCDFGEASRNRSSCEWASLKRFSRSGVEGQGHICTSVWILYRLRYICFDNVTSSRLVKCLFARYCCFVCACI